MFRSKAVQEITCCNVVDASGDAVASHSDFASFSSLFSESISNDLVRVRVAFVAEAKLLMNVHSKLSQQLHSLTCFRCGTFYSFTVYSHSWADILVYRDTSVQGEKTCLRSRNSGAV